jgi:hypothetical protein
VHNGVFTGQEIDIQALENGLYFIQVLDGKSMINAQKFIKTSK